MTKRVAIAKGTMYLGHKIISLLEKEELTTKKGPVFQTSIVAGIQAVKKTSDLIPMCHPIFVNGINIEINVIGDKIVIHCKVVTEGKTGVEMESLTGVSVTALTIYDMCKSISQDMRIEEIKLIEKTGGKSDIIKE